MSIKDLIFLSILERLNTMSAELEALKTAVRNNTTVIGSAVVLINGFQAKLEEAIAKAQNGDTQALPDLVAELAAQDQALASAVSANTGPSEPGAPSPDPTPAPDPAPTPAP